MIKKPKEISELSEGEGRCHCWPSYRTMERSKGKKIFPSAEELEEKLGLVNFKNIEATQKIS